MTFRLIGVPSSAGAYGPGQEGAPAALRRAGLIDCIDADVADGGDLAETVFRPDPQHRSAQNVDTVVAIASEVRRIVGAAVSEETVPVVLGGDCTITLGVVAGVRDFHPDAVLAYFDGDVDLSTPETTKSGILDAMGIAHLLAIDGTNQQLAGIGATTPLLTGGDLVLIGYEDNELTIDHRRTLARHEVACFAAELLRTNPAATLRHITEVLGSRPRIVHFDVDAVDSVDCPLAEFPHFNTGVTLETATAILGDLCATPQLAAVVITEVNPRRDPDAVHIPRLRDTVATALNRAVEAAGC